MQGSPIFKCSRCFEIIKGTPKKRWEETLKGVRLEFTFCEKCSKRIDNDPKWQFTCTGWPINGEPSNGKSSS